jgi:hypothetical protein
MQVVRFDSNNLNLIQSADVANVGNIIVKEINSALKRQDYIVVLLQLESKLTKFPPPVN